MNNSSTDNDYFNPAVYTHFKSHMLKHHIIDLSKYPNLVSFLQQDSILLDEENSKLIERDFTDTINELIDEYDSLFIKLNFSAPTDALFLIPELKCFSLTEVYELLKGSTKLNDNFSLYSQMLNKNNKNDNKNDNHYTVTDSDSDLNCPAQLHLIVKPWYKIDPRDEFRLFIDDDRQLKGICQRYLNYYFEYTHDDIQEVTQAIKKLMSDIYNENGSNAKTKTKTKLFIDIVYLRSKGKAKIIDVMTEGNRVLLNTQGDNNDNDNDNDPHNSDDYFLLFDSWKIITSTYNEETGPVFKYIKSDGEIKDTKENLNQFPLEIIGMGSGGDTDKMMELIAIMTTKGGNI